MSRRAPCRLEALGFEQVYDYTAGIADWKAAGLDVDGTARPGFRIAGATRPEHPDSPATRKDPRGHLIGAILADDARRLVSSEAPERVWKKLRRLPRTLEPSRADQLTPQRAVVWWLGQRRLDEGAGG